MQLALYIHWPFCRKKCPYCDFNSHVRDVIDAEEWRHALLQELSYMQRCIPQAELISIFFGGGTPSLMPPAIAEALIEQATQGWRATSDLEITLEANPTSVEAQRFADFKRAGINRLSMGVQSLDDTQLAFLGREHSAKEALRAWELATQHFSRHSFDLIYALPNQTAQAWQDELMQALGYAGTHLSLYQLTIEPNTAFYHQYHNKKLFSLPEEDPARALYEQTQTVMEQTGLPAYEISNHAGMGEECRHNMHIWRGGAYAGIGPGAHGRIMQKGQWIATNTHKSPERWLELVQKDGHGYEAWQALSAAEHVEEQLMLGLRLREGIAYTPLQQSGILNQLALETLIGSGLLRLEQDRLVATQEGWLVLNSVLGYVIQPEATGSASVQGQAPESPAA